MPEILLETATISAAGGIQLFVYRYSPVERNERALLIFIHGFVEHSGRYDCFFRWLATKGIGVVAADLRGHGKSEGRRAWIRSLDDVLADFNRVWAWARQAAATIPMFVMGHSLGGLLAAEWVVRNVPNIDGLILSAPAITVGAVPGWMRQLAPVVAAILPWAKIVRVGVKGLSRDPAVRREFETDPLVYHGRIPAQSGRAILTAAARFRKHAAEVAVPLLILQGTADRICTPEGSQELFERARSSDKTLRLYPGLYHDLLHEPEADRIRADVLDWVERRLPSGR